MNKHTFWFFFPKANRMYFKPKDHLIYYYPKPGKIVSPLIETFWNDRLAITRLHLPDYAMDLWEKEDKNHKVHFLEKWFEIVKKRSQIKPTNVINQTVDAVVDFTIDQSVQLGLKMEESVEEGISRFFGLFLVVGCIGVILYMNNKEKWQI